MAPVLTGPCVVSLRRPRGTHGMAVSDDNFRPALYAEMHMVQEECASGCRTRPPEGSNPSLSAHKPMSGPLGPESQGSRGPVDCDVDKGRSRQSGRRGTGAPHQKSESEHHDIAQIRALGALLRAHVRLIELRPAMESPHDRHPIELQLSGARRTQDM